MLYSNIYHTVLSRGIQNSLGSFFATIIWFIIKYCVYTENLWNPTKHHTYHTHIYTRQYYMRNQSRKIFNFIVFSWCVVNFMACTLFHIQNRKSTFHFCCVCVVYTFTCHSNSHMPIRGNNMGKCQFKNPVYSRKPIE